MAITLEDIKKLSPRNKAIIIVILCLLIAYFYYYFFLQSVMEKKGSLETQLADLSKQVKEKEEKAAQLGQYIKEVADLKVKYQDALLKLPNKKEIPGLLNSIALAGKQEKIEFVLFEPKPPPPPPPPKSAEGAQAAKPADQKTSEAKPQAPPEEKFYEEIPVKVIIRGTYHNTALFFERVAKLPRIVNIEDIIVGDAKEVPGKGLILITSCVIKTYMFIEKKSE